MPVEAGAQPGERHVDAPDPGHPHGLGVAPEEQDSATPQPPRRRSGPRSGLATPARARASRSTLPSTAQVNDTQMTPSMVSPTRAAQSSWR